VRVFEYDKRFDCAWHLKMQMSAEVVRHRIRQYAIPHINVYKIK